MVEPARSLGRTAQGRSGACSVIDVSGSMKERGRDRHERDTKLDLAKSAAIDSLGRLQGQRPRGSARLHDEHRRERHLRGPGADRARSRRTPTPCASQIEGLYPQNGTPLYDVTSQSFQTMYDSYDPDRINAVVLLTDGKNDDGEVSDDNRQLQDTLRSYGTRARASSACRCVCSPSATGPTPT